MAEPLGNFYETKKRRARVRRYVHLVAFGTLSLLLLGGVAWLLFWSPLLRVESVIVEGNRRTPETQILAFLAVRAAEGGLWRQWVGRENILWWPERVETDDFRIIPAVKKITIEKDYRRRTVTVVVGERDPYGIWCLKGEAASTLPALRRECWWFDREGFVFEEALVAEGSLVRVVNDYSQESLEIGSLVLPPHLIPNLLSIFRVSEEARLALEEIRLNDLRLEELEIQLLDGPALYFSLRFSAQNALPVIQNLLGTPEGRKIKYIDFRVENRAYYK